MGTVSSSHPAAVPATAGPVHVVLATASAEVGRRLQLALQGVAVVHTAALEGPAVLQQLEAVRAQAVLVDFGEGAREQAAATAEVLRLQAAAPALVGVGRATQGADAIAALRAKVREFMDIDAPAGDLQLLLARVLQHPRPGPERQGRAIALLGARGGLGVSTLAVNLAAMLQRQGAGRRTLLLDLGLPVADSGTLLGVDSGFTFADAARALDRLDRTLVDTAIPRSTHGIAVLPLPAQLQELREISHVTANAVLARLRQFFDAIVVDLGGFTHTDFVLRIAAHCDPCLVVTDQATTSVVSSARLAAELADKGVPARLLLNRCDPALAPTPAQLATHLGLPVAGRLPERYVAHVRALNEERLLADSPSDPYTRALQVLAASLLAPEPAAAGGTRPWLARLGLGGTAS